MVAAGICQSDLGGARGHFPFPLPGVLGHEGVGVVARGVAVNRVDIGDRVILSFSFCGRCRWCHTDHPGYCEDKVQLNLVSGRRPDRSPTIRNGGHELGAHLFGQSSFAEHAIVHERSLIVLPADLPSTLLPACTILACGGQAGAWAVLNVLPPRPAHVVVVAGAGGVGLSAVMTARLIRPAKVIVVDRVTSRLDLAGELSADAVIDTRTPIWPRS
jgi:aryl-alcohol dehydrogenase